MASYATATRNARQDRITTDIGSNGRMKTYDGTPPVNVGTALSGNTLLADQALSATAAPASVNGVLTFDPVSDVAAAAGGTPSFSRLTTSGGTAIVQVSCGTSGTEAIINASPIVANATIKCSSIVLTEGNA